MKTNLFSERGQAIVLIALGIVGLVGMTALAIDGGNAYSDRRHAQNAADTAVLSAALAKTRENPWQSAGIDMASNNGYDDTDANQSVFIHTCATAPGCSAPYDGSNPDLFPPEEFIRIEITSKVDTFFAPVIGVAQVTNRVEAIARAKPSKEMFFGNAMVALAPTGKSVYTLNGGPDTEITGGGIFVNSDSDDCAFKSNGVGDDFSVPSITVVGESCPSTIGSVTATEGADQLSPPDYSWLDTAIGCSDSTTLYNASNDLIDGGATIAPHTSPLRFTSSFPPTNVVKLEAGVYCLEGGFSINSNTAVLDGENVTFVMRSGTLTLNGGEITLSAPSSGITAGLLFYQPVSNTNTATFNGGTKLLLTGSILMPGALVKITGSAGTTINGQVTGYELELGGSSGSAVNYDDTQNINDPPQIELIQ